MRTVIFVGLMTISDSISAQTGHVMSDAVSGICEIIFIVSAAMDLADFIRGEK